MDAVWSWITALVLVICTYAGYLAFERYKRLRLFKDLGVDGPQPNFISGNMKDVQTGSKLPVETMMKWQKRYGKVFGYFRGTCPTLVVADFELMKRILIKDVANFVNRPKMPWNFKPSAKALIGLRDEEWKEVRKTLSPTFSTSKMKQMTNIMNRTVSVFCSEVEKTHESQQEFDIYDKFQRLTLEVIGECALAMRIECQTVEKNFTFEAVRTFLQGSANNSVMYLIFSYFPWLSFVVRPYLNRLPVMRMVKRLLENVQYVINQRRQNPEKHKTIDVLQLMLDAGRSSEVLREDDDALDRIVKSSQRKPLTDDQIVGNIWIFLLGGFETTATTLAYTVHCLVANPDVQERVYQEIVSNIQVCVDISPQNVRELINRLF